MRVVEVGQYFVTKDTGDFWQFQSVACREYTPSTRRPNFSNKRVDPRKYENWTCNNLFLNTPSMELKFKLSQRQFSFLGQNFLWNGQICDRFYWGWKFRNSCRSTRRANSTKKHECCCSQVKGKSKTSTERTCWDDSNHTNTSKKMDWHWTIKTRSRFVRSLEESHQSSSTQSDVTAIRRWSNWILQDKILSSKSSFTNTEFVWWSMESLFGCRRRIQTKISVLLW